MKIVLDLATGAHALIFSDILHEEALKTIDKMLNFNHNLADRSYSLKYFYVPGKELYIKGYEKWLRIFCNRHDLTIEVRYPFPPMPKN